MLEAKNESQTIEKLAQLFQFWHMQQHLLDAVHELKSLQHPNGSFSWMRGGADDRFVTQNIISGIGRLIQLKALNSELLKELMEIAVPGIRYLDSQLAADYDRQKKSASKTSVLDPMQIQYLYMRSLFPSVAVPGTIFNAYNYYRKLSTTTWVPLNRQLQGLLALALYRTGDSFNARKILRSLQENALFNEELGMYWKDAAPGYSWYHAGVSTQSVMIEAFAEIGKDTSLVEKLKVWLIKNKQTNSWNGDKSTADACYALLSYGANWLGSSPEVEIRAGALRIAPTAAEQQAGTGYFKRTIDGPKIKPDMGDIQVFVKSGRAPQPMYGAVYWQYMEDLDRITVSKGPVNVVKRLFIQSNSPSGPVFEELRENATLKIGDKIKVRLEFRTDRSMDYVHLSDMRASGMEPLSTLSGYTWKGGIGYYQVTRDASSDFYIDHLPRGTFVIEYGLVVNSSGSFTNGISTVQCMYAPEFTGHTQAIRVHIEQ